MTTTAPVSLRKRVMQQLEDMPHYRRICWLCDYQFRVVYVDTGYWILYDHRGAKPESHTFQYGHRCTSNRDDLARGEIVDWIVAWGKSVDE